MQRIDLVDRGRQGGERAVHDGHRLADREVDDLDLRLVRGTGRSAASLPISPLAGRRQDFHDFVDRQRRWA